MCWRQGLDSHVLHDSLPQNHLWWEKKLLFTFCKNRHCEEEMLQLHSAFACDALKHPSMSRPLWDAQSNSHLFWAPVGD